MPSPSRVFAVALLATLATFQAAAQTTVTFAGYTGLFQDIYTKAVLEPFMKANPDIKVSYFSPGNSAAILGVLRAQKGSPQVDVAVIDMAVAKAGSDEGLFVPIDASVAEHVRDLYPQALIPGVNLAGDPTRLSPRSP